MDKQKIFNELVENYRQKNKKSEELFRKPSQCQIRRGSQNLRLFAPSPFCDARCNGSQVTDIDGNTYMDFWQGDFGML